jgi:hypothetical protein
LWVLRYSIAIPFFLWGIDYLLNYKRHIGWMQLFSYLGRNLPANELLYLIISVASVEIVIAVLIVIAKGALLRYALFASTVFLISAVTVLDPPVNNHQSIGIAFSTAWLTYIFFTKRQD